MKELGELFDNRRAFPSCIQDTLKLDRKAFTSQVGHTQNLISTMEKICTDINEHYKMRIHTHISDVPYLHMWDMNSIRLHDTLTSDLCARTEQLREYSKAHYNKVINTQLCDGLQQLESMLPAELFTNVSQVITRYSHMQQRVSWDRFHKHDTNRMDIINVRV